MLSSRVMNDVGSSSDSVLEQFSVLAARATGATAPFDAVPRLREGF
jgi:hypothetical protein